jgi:hypothetical protein
MALGTADGEQLHRSGQGIAAERVGGARAEAARRPETGQIQMRSAATCA